MKTSQKGIDLIKKWEGFSPHSYLCPGQVWTIGYGATKIKGQSVYPGMKITEEEAEELLREQLPLYENIVHEHITVGLTQNQFDALVSFAYNLGSQGFRYYSQKEKKWKDSGLKRALNNRQFVKASEELMQWIYSGGKKLEGLENRRKDERRLFLAL